MPSTADPPIALSAQLEPAGSAEMVGAPWPPAQGQGRARTHPKCCTTLGSMAASCSMEGNWYLQAEHQVRPSAAGGTGLGKAGEWVAPGTYP